MANDRNDFDRTTKDLMSACINKAATQLRVKSHEALFVQLREHNEQKFQLLQQEFKEV